MTAPASTRLLRARRALARTACVSMALGLGACEAAPRDVQGLWAALQAEVGTASCTSDAQCRTIAVGAKPCGGPSSYLAWSTAVSQEARLSALARDHAQAAKDENLRTGRMSDCALVTDPGAVCSPAGRCELRARGGSGAAM